MAEVRVLSAVGGRVLCRRVAIASSFTQRLFGLMGRRQLGSDEALYLPGTNSIHMLFMRFPIDCLFLSQPDATGTQTIVDMRRSLPPWRGVIWYVRGARGVVEMPAGTIDATGVEIGDGVRLAEEGQATDR